jgi:hypothetical protein
LYALGFFLYALTKKGPLLLERKGRKSLILIVMFGAPGEIRTPDPLVRSQILYPTELRARSAQARVRTIGKYSKRVKRQLIAHDIFLLATLLGFELPLTWLWFQLW